MSPALPAPGSVIEGGMTSDGDGVDPAIRRYISCRLIGHVWSLIPESEYEWRPTVGLRGLVLGCGACGTYRYDSFDVRGYVNARSYEYPDDYSVQAEHAISRQEVRAYWASNYNGNGSRRRGARRAS